MEMKATNEIVNRMNLNIHELSSERVFRGNLKLKIAREMIFTVLMQDVWCGSAERTERIFLIFHRAGLKGSWRSCCARFHRVFISTHTKTIHRQREPDVRHFSRYRDSFHLFKRVLHHKMRFSSAKRDVKLFFPSFAAFRNRAGEDERIYGKKYKPPRAAWELQKL